MLERPQPRSGQDERAWRRQAAEDPQEARKGSFAVGLSGSRWCSRSVAGGVISQAPIRRRRRAAAAM